VLLLVTLATTTMSGATHYAAFMSEFERRPILFTLSSLIDPHWLARGLWYSLTILAILGAHEMGHYLYCRRHNVDATLPYFLPMPPLIFLTGTLGAVIRIREAFPNRKVLFDIGVAGPIAGFVVLVPALFLGMHLSYIVPAPTSGVVYSMGEPLLFQWATRLMFGTIRDGYALNMHPMVFASWFGMLATSLNLLPFGQLDRDGHRLRPDDVPVNELGVHDPDDAGHARHARPAPPARDGRARAARPRPDRDRGGCAADPRAVFHAHADRAPGLDRRAVDTAL
jgi:hypothetical protein